MPLTPTERETFLRKLLDKFHELDAKEAKADMNIYLGRRDKETQALLPPGFNIREYID